MRHFALITTLTLLAACDGGTQFAHTSTLHTDARGVALADGNDARVGMSGTTCDVDPSYASVGTDYDYPGQNDRIEDVEQGKVVVTSDDGVHIVDRDPIAGSTEQDFPLSHVQVTEAVAIDGGAVTLGENTAGCQLDWVGTDTDASAAMKPELCEANPTIAADPVTGDTWIGTADGIHIATPQADSVSPFVDEGADLLVFDSATDLMYAAVRGDTEVRAMDLGGTTVWSTDVTGAVVDIEDFGSRASALVTVQYTDGSGSVIVIDGLTGEITSEMGLPDGDNEIVSSEGGGQIALLRQGEVHFYEVFTWLPASILE